MKKEAHALVALLYMHVGPALKALLLSICNQSSGKEQLQKCFEETKYDPQIKEKIFVKKSIESNQLTQNDSVDRNQQIPSLEIPKTDIISILSKDIISRIVSITVLLHFC